MIGPGITPTPNTFNIYECKLNIKFIFFIFETFDQISQPPP